MKLPVTVRAPNRTSNPSAPMRMPSRTPAASRYSTIPTRVAARAPNMWEIAMRCGMAVMGTMNPSGIPTTVPSTRPPMIQS